MKTLNRPTHPLLTVGLAAIMAAPVLLAAPGAADADVDVSVRGNLRVRVGSPIVVRHHGYRTHEPRHRLHIRGSIHLGGGIVYGGGYSSSYAEAPPPVSVYDCEPDVPAYYTPAPPVDVYTAPVVVVADPLGPRFGVGVFAGSMSVDGNEGDDVGLLARYRLTHSLTLEGELAKTTLDDQATRRAGGALLWDLSAHSRLSPHLLAGAGSWDSRAYAEVGAGLTFRLSERLHIAADIRAGARAAAEEDVPRADGGPIMFVIGEPSSTEDQRYTRARLSAILYF